MEGQPLKPWGGAAPKQQVIDNTPMRIGSLNFGIFSNADIRAQSTIEVSDRHLYDTGGGRVQTRNGPLDLRLGNTSKRDLCQTCDQDQRACNGHWGYIKLFAPCYHVGFLAFTIEALNQICKTCANFLLDDTNKRKYIRSLRRPGLDGQQKKALLKRIQLECRKKYVCTHCGASNGPVRKVPGHACKVVHLKFDHFHKSTAKTKKPPRDKRVFDAAFGTYLEELPDMERHVNKAVDDLPALKAYSLLSQVSTEDCELLGLDPTKGRPESYLWTCLPVPPTSIRPSVPGEAGTTEDELTAKLSQIIDLNSRFKAAFIGEEAPVVWMDLYEKLQDHIAMYINSHAPGLNKTEYGKAIRSFCTRLKGKQGRFRGNLSGKRVNFSGRTVIGPDPNLSIEEVGMPVHVAKILTYPESVTATNLENMKATIRNGASKWPGANLIHKKGGRTLHIKIMEKLKPQVFQKTIDDLRIGDVVDRHIINGDIVLFNRQPSLHKLSVLCHRVRVHPGRTFRFNESVCNPYNADFDGDEMNIHVPQTEEARTEAIELMGVKHNLITPKNGAPIIAPIQDFITAAYLLSLKDRFFTRAEFAQIVGYMFDATAIKDPVTGTYMGYELPPPTILKPMFLWTGKQVFGVLMRPNKKSNVQINAEAPCRAYKAVPKGIAPDMVEDDSYLVVRNSQIMCGVMDKSVIGDGNKVSIFYGMLRDYGEDYAVMGMNRLAKLSARWLGTQGFSIGIGDVYPSERLNARKEQLIEESSVVVLQKIKDFTEGNLKRDAGCDAAMSLENQISGLLSKVRQSAGAACFEELKRWNSAVIMAKCGSKGSLINVSQMVASVGQQMIGGARVEDGFQDRSLPHFRKGARDAASKGFVKNSFFSGLTPAEFIFHAMSGREGLVDTAVKTAETGYMSRRLIKSLEDNYILYDNTVRTSSGTVIQFRFGDDSLDPAELEGDNAPVDLDRTWVHALETTFEVNATGLMPGEVVRHVEQVLSRERKKYPRSTLAGESLDYNDASPDGIDFDEGNRKFIDQLSGFIASKADRLNILHRQYTGMTDRAPSQKRTRKGRSKGQVEDPMDLDVANDKGTVDNILKITTRSLDEFLRQCLGKYERSRVQPGHAVGAIAAQSIGEPGTQMTLKTFHFAGVAGMSITQGVPRIKEIINAAKRISTPIITCELVNKNDVRAASIVKARIEKTYLRDIIAYVADEWGPRNGILRLRVDISRIEQLQLEIGWDQIIRAIVKHKPLKLKDRQVRRSGNNHIEIHLDESKFDDGNEEVDYDILDVVKAKIAAASAPGKGKKFTSVMMKPPAKGRARKPAQIASITLEELKRLILDVVVKGYPEAQRAVISRSEQSNAQGVEEMSVVVEGYGLKECMGTEGVNGLRTKTNNVIETQNVLGIEAARTSIIREMGEVLKQMDIDSHHLALLACTMTAKGECLGITRFGMSKFKDSVLQLASFEKTPDHLFDAATKCKDDRIEGVSESIIMGQPVKLGTGIAHVIRPLKLDEGASGEGMMREKGALFHEAFFSASEAKGWDGVSWDAVGRSIGIAAA